MGFEIIRDEKGNLDPSYNPIPKILGDGKYITTKPSDDQKSVIITLTDEFRERIEKIEAKQKDLEDHLKVLIRLTLAK